MPLYQFRCKKCEFEYDEFSKFDPAGKYKGIKCPECQSSRKTQLISVPSFAFGNPVGTDRWTSEGTGHDYRFNYNMPNVRKHRAVAAEKSHVGANPYNKIDDISSGNHFGEVK